MSDRQGLMAHDPIGPTLCRLHSTSKPRAVFRTPCPRTIPPHPSMHLLLFLLLWPFTALAMVFDLSTLDWTLVNQNGSISVPATVPSQMHLDLTRAGVITEPLLGINDFTERWVFMDNWTYTANLAPILRNGLDFAGQTLLVFYGLDTIANITVAGQPVAWVNNQFREYVFDVSFLSSATAGNLTVVFESAYYYGLNVSMRPDAENLLDAIVGDTFEVPADRAYIRKLQSDFGWDWGPAFVPSGIFRPAYLIALTNGANRNSTPNTTASPQPVFVEETSVDIYKVGQNFSVPANETADWVVNVTMAVRSAGTFTSPSISLAFPELNLTSPTFRLDPIPITKDSPLWFTVLWQIPDAIPERWYPHNLGTPTLYDLTVSLGLQRSTDVNVTVRTGFRTIKLAQLAYSREDIDTRGITPGDQWHFEINGKAFYSLGTNIIPFDPFYARITTEQVRWVLESAVRSGQNMLRVWGGGIYQPDSEADGVYDFYSLCDELGILAWSEFIFSDSLYPINDFMLESIEPEVRQNVRRINKHPSNVQWAGGNEIEGIVTSVNTSVSNGTIYLDQFVALFQDFLYDITVSETHSVPYTDCSTTKGVLSLDPYVLRFNNGTPGEIYGNSERYNYDASQAFNYSTFPVSRFVNEFGFHSMPSFYSWEEVLLSPDDFSFNSTIVMSRDHHPPAGNLSFPNPNAPQGQAEMTEAVELWLPTPSTPDSNQTFAQWCWSTQIFQSMTMMSEIAWYRRGAGQGENNLGALVWQLNDIWQGVSWSAIEYSGRWKVLQYGITTTFSPVMIYPFWTPDNETLQVMVTSDRWESVDGSAQLTWYDWLGNTLSTSTHRFTVPSLNNSLISQRLGLNAILPAGHNATNVWMLLNLTAQVDKKTVTNEQYFTPVSLANVPLVDPRIHMTATKNLTFTLSALGGVAPWTWLDHPAGTVGMFVDNTTGVPSNGFYLVPGIDRTLKFILNEKLSRITSPDPADFVLRSLWNNTHAS
ncbi:glycoside hydrolase family 2 protein [Mycena maculata]|uniref:Beta-mannosidase A n=1 Tax=Mycena maculata TaxID=230809 RepID=A0AAD7J5J6_9AGAR|nr:glycoside hydrolase family 2 protein [Mycena maculata]